MNNYTPYSHWLSEALYQPDREFYPKKMKKKIIVLLVSLTMFIACDTLKGHRGISKNIEQSKEIGSFIKEYQLISDTLNLAGIKSIWSEHGWNHAGWFEKEKINRESHTLIFEFYNSNKLNRYDTLWAFSKSTNDYERFDCAGRSQYQLIFCESGDYLKDTIRFNLVRGNLLFNKIESINKVMLVSK